MPQPPPSHLLVASPAPNFFSRFRYCGLAPSKAYFPSLGLSRHPLACGLPLPPDPLKGLFPVPRPFRWSVASRSMEFWLCPKLFRACECRQASSKLFPSLGLSRHQLACGLPCSKLFLSLPSRLTPSKAYSRPWAFPGISWLVTCPAPSFFLRFLDSRLAPSKSYFPSLGLFRHQLVHGLTLLQTFSSFPRVPPGPFKGLFPVPGPFQTSVGLWPALPQAFSYASETAA